MSAGLAARWPPDRVSRVLTRRGPSHAGNGLLVRPHRADPLRTPNALGRVPRCNHPRQSLKVLYREIDLGRAAIARSTWVEQPRRPHSQENGYARGGSGGASDEASHLRTLSATTSFSHRLAGCRSTEPRSAPRTVANKRSTDPRISSGDRDPSTRRTANPRSAATDATRSAYSWSFLILFSRATRGFAVGGSARRARTDRWNSFVGMRETAAAPGGKRSGRTCGPSTRVEGRLGSWATSSIASRNRSREVWAKASACSSGDS
jgi:hypothetical protein